VKKTFAAIASAVVLLSASAFTSAAPLASSDPAVVAATREMLATMKTREMLAVILRQMEQQMNSTRAVAEAHAIVAKYPAPEQQAEPLKRAHAKLDAEYAKMHARLSDPTLVDELIEELVPLYAETYTLDEIRQMTAFYASPLGQKMQANAPELMKRSAEISRWFVMSREPKAPVEGEQTAAR
jgi:hypothetical protein